MKKEWNDVREFHEKFGHPVAPQPRMMERGRALSRGKWMNEEVAEFLVAQDIYEQADAMIDLIYFALGTLVEMGLEADELFDIVQKANMAKLWPDGKPHYNPKDGKVIKPDGWEDPAPKNQGLYRCGHRPQGAEITHPNPERRAMPGVFVARKGVSGFRIFRLNPMDTAQTGGASAKPK